MKGRKKGERADVTDQVHVIRQRTQSGGEASLLVEHFESDGGPATHTVFERAEIHFFAAQLRLSRFTNSFIENTLFQNEPLPVEIREKIISQ